MDLRQAVEIAKGILNKGKDSQTIDRTDFLDSVYEHKRRFQQKGHFWHNRWHRTENRQIDGLDG